MVLKIQKESLQFKLLKIFQEIKTPRYDPRITPKREQLQNIPNNPLE